MDHVLEYLSEDENIVTFKCSKCQTQINFVKPGLGEPNPVKTETSWEPNPNFMESMNECSG